MPETEVRKILSLMGIPSAPGYLRTERLAPLIKLIEDHRQAIAALPTTKELDLLARMARESGAFGSEEWLLKLQEKVEKVVEFEDHLKIKREVAHA